MTLVEESYRWWRRLLPAWYRLDREGEMVATFIEGAGSGEDAEIARPSWAEIRGVLALAVRTRLGGAGAVPRACACGEGARVFALGAVLMQAIFATIMAWDALHGYILASAAQRRAWMAMSGPPTPRDLELWLAPAVWMVVYLAVVLGRWRAARWFALAAAIHTLYWLNTATTIAAVQAVMVGLTTLALLIAAVRILRRLPARAATASLGPGLALPG
jgi:hypothetical protein